MTARHRPAARRPLATVVLCLAAAHGAAAPAAANAAAPSRLQRLLARVDDALATRCLTPASGEALQRAVAAGALQPALGDAFRLEKGDIQPQHIEIAIRGRDGASHVVRLAIAGSESGTPAGAGSIFEFFLRGPGDPPDQETRAVLLAAAAAVDAAVPAATLERCAGSGAPHAERRYPRALALGGAALQVLAIAAAVLFALRTLRDPAARAP